MCAACSTHLINRPWLDFDNNILWTVQTMEILTMQFSPSSCHFISLRFKYSPKHPQSALFCYCERPCFTPTKKLEVKLILMYVKH
jgi:hypothetical protein